ncbi:MAG TPA: prolipoprotein diacylglyceryl transferase [Gemmatimonadales bacterium]|nr:prolipoprotein diacylglyceryl transferase [Gemmatimonadales bacterium]
MTVYPLIIRLGSFEITGYGIMMMVAFLVGGWLVGLELRRRALREEYATDIVAAAVVGGIIGAKLWYVALTQDLGSLFSRGGLVWYGGFIGGALAVLLNGWRLKVPARWTMQVGAPALAAAYALGRVGCFLVNDDYGRPTDLPWAMKFPQGLPPSTAATLQAQFGVPIPPGTDQTTVLAVHPTQLYETLIMLVAFAVIWRLRIRPSATGWLFGVYLVFAGAERFLVEFVRAKDDRFIGAFTLAQLTSVGLVMLGALLMARWHAGAEVPPGPYLSAAGNQAEKKTWSASETAVRK